MNRTTCLIVSANGVERLQKAADDAVGKVASALERNGGMVIGVSIASLSRVSSDSNELAAAINIEYDE